MVTLASMLGVGMALIGFGAVVLVVGVLVTAWMEGWI